MQSRAAPRARSPLENFRRGCKTPLLKPFYSPLFVPQRQLAAFPESNTRRNRQPPFLRESPGKSAREKGIWKETRRSVNAFRDEERFFSQGTGAGMGWADTAAASCTGHDEASQADVCPWTATRAKALQRRASDQRLTKGRALECSTWRATVPYRQRWRDPCPAGYRPTDRQQRHHQLRWCR